MGYTSYKGPVMEGVMQAVAKGFMQFAFEAVEIARVKAPIGPPISSKPRKRGSTGVRQSGGQLRQSGKVVTNSPTHLSIQFARSGPDGYNVAARQEFDEKLKHPRGGQAHYLGGTVEEMRPKMPEYVARYKR